MTTVFTTQVVPESAAQAKKKHKRHHKPHKTNKRFHITVEAAHPKDRVTYIFPYGPTASSYNGAPNQYQTVNRPGKRPLFLQSGGSLPTWSCTVTLAHLDNQKSIANWIGHLKHMAGTNQHLVLKYGDSLHGYWRMTQCDINVTMYNRENNPSQATADLAFTRASDAHVHIGPASGGVKRKPHKAHHPGKKHGSDKHKHVSIHVVAKGETLWTIAAQYYGDPAKWIKIADYNHIQHPKHVTPGTRLKLPE